MAQKVTLWKRRLQDDGMAAEDADLVAKYFAADSDDGPELEALVKATMAKPDRVEIRKDDAGAKPVTQTRSLAELQVDITKLAAQLQTSEANIEALDALQLARQGTPESVAKAGAIFRDSPQAYEAYMAHLRGERWQAPVAVAKAEKDYKAEIIALLRGKKHKELRLLLRSNKAAAEQYSKLVRSGGLMAAV